MDLPYLAGRRLNCFYSSFLKFICASANGAAAIARCTTQATPYACLFTSPHKLIPCLGSCGRKLIAVRIQACYSNATELLFATMTIYNMRIVERLWGSRKFAV